MIRGLSADLSFFMPLIRLQKFLSLAGVCSRRKGEIFIKAGWVKVNGETVTELGSNAGVSMYTNPFAVTGIP